jgi:uncharacterized protein
MTSDINWLFIVLSLLAEVIGTVGGFGSSVFFVPIASFFLPFDQVLALTAILHVSSNFSKIMLFKSGLIWRIIYTIGIPSIIMVIVGGFASKYFLDNNLSLFLNIFLIVFSLILLIKPKFKVSTKAGYGILGGSISGFLAGFIGTGGAVRGLVLAAYDLNISSFVATSAVIDFAIDASRTVVYIYNGYATPAIYIYIPLLLGIGFIGTYLGKKILAKISQTYFRKLSLILILIIGLIGLIFGTKMY